MAGRPTIVSLSPTKYQKSVPISTSIRADFSIDLDSRYIEDNVFMTDGKGQRVDIRTSYRAKVLTVMPLSPLSMGTTYQVTFVGDSNLDDDVKQGLRSIIGDCMGGNEVLTFTTEVDESLTVPEVLLPVQGAVLKAKPTFKWNPVNTAKGYHIEISKTNTFASLIYPKEQQVITTNELDVDVVMEDGLYYWRIRSVRNDGATGEWSKAYQFNIDTLEEGKVSEEDDDSSIDDFLEYDENDFELEIVERFPKELEALVPTNIKCMFFRIIGKFDLKLITPDSITLTGHHISGDFQEESHGTVKGDITVVQSKDGTSYIIFTPEPIPDKEAGEV